MTLGASKGNPVFGPLAGQRRWAVLSGVIWALPPGHSLPQGGRLGHQLLQDSGSDPSRHLLPATLAAADS